MKWYRVIVIQVSGRRNRLFNYDAEVNEQHFPEGVADELVKAKKLEFLRDDQEEARTEPQEPTTVPKPEIVKPDAPEFKSVTRAVMMRDLREAGAEVGANESKDELWEKWKSVKGFK